MYMNVYMYGKTHCAKIYQSQELNHISAYLTKIREDLKSYRHVTQ